MGAARACAYVCVCVITLHAKSTHMDESIACQNESAENVCVKGKKTQGKKRWIQRGRSGGDGGIEGWQVRRCKVPSGNRFWRPELPSAAALCRCRE